MELSRRLDKLAHQVDVLATLAEFTSYSQKKDDFIAQTFFSRDGMSHMMDTLDDIREELGRLSDDVYDLEDKVKNPRDYVKKAQ